MSDLDARDEATLKHLEQLFAESFERDKEFRSKLDSMKDEIDLFLRNHNFAFFSKMLVKRLVALDNCPDLIKTLQGEQWLGMLLHTATHVVQEINEQQ